MARPVPPYFFESEHAVCFTASSLLVSRQTLGGQGISEAVFSCRVRDRLRATVVSRRWVERNWAIPDVQLGRFARCLGSVVSCVLSVVVFLFSSRTSALLRLHSSCVDPAGTGVPGTAGNGSHAQ